LDQNLNLLPYLFKIPVKITVMYETIKLEKIGGEVINDSLRVGKRDSGGINNSAPDFRKIIAVCEGSNSTPACPSDRRRVKIKMNMVYLLNVFDR
jgi:hypothetical protein